MSGRFSFGCAALVVLFANVAFGDGSYQRTKDGKTMVWNNDPRPNDEATWAGGRDREGYASGFGTLTWYTKPKQTVKRLGIPFTKNDVYARYFGNMVQGKFEGAVNVHSKGKTDHAIFVDGKRTTRWAGGPAPSRRLAEPSVEVAKQERVAATESASAKRSGVKEPEAPAAGPAVQRPQVAKAENTQPRIEEARPTPKPSVEPEVAAEPSPIPAAVKPVAKAPPAPNKKPKTEVDDSLRSMFGPPSSLRTDPNGNAMSLGAKPESSPNATARLTPEEVVDLANSEARLRGYDLAAYPRQEPQYNAADDTWSVAYEQKADANETAEVGTHFSITIDDKTKGTVFVPGK